MSDFKTKKRDKINAIPDKNKIQCKICGLWYIKPCSHIVQRHGIPARHYKEAFGYELKKGLVTEELRNKFHLIGIANPSWKKNLVERGAKYRFKIGFDPRRVYRRSAETIIKLRQKLGEIKNRKTTFIDSIFRRIRKLFS